MLITENSVVKLLNGSRLLLLLLLLFSLDVIVVCKVMVSLFLGSKCPACSFSKYTVIYLTKTAVKYSNCFNSARSYKFAGANKKAAPEPTCDYSIFCFWCPLKSSTSIISIANLTDHSAAKGTYRKPTKSSALATILPITQYASPSTSCYFSATFTPSNTNALCL